MWNKPSSDANEEEIQPQQSKNDLPFRDMRSEGYVGVVKNLLQEMRELSNEEFQADNCMQQIQDITRELQSLHIDNQQKQKLIEEIKSLVREKTTPNETSNDVHSIINDLCTEINNHLEPYNQNSDCEDISINNAKTLPYIADSIVELEDYQEDEQAQVMLQHLRQLQYAIQTFSWIKSKLSSLRNKHTVQEIEHWSTMGNNFMTLQDCISALKPLENYSSDAQSTLRYLLQVYNVCKDYNHNFAH